MSEIVLFEQLRFVHDERSVAAGVVIYRKQFSVVMSRDQASKALVY